MFARQDTITRMSPYHKHSLEVIFTVPVWKKTYKNPINLFTQQAGYHNSTNIHVLRWRRHHPTRSFKPQLPCWFTAPSLSPNCTLNGDQSFHFRTKCPSLILSLLSSRALNYFPNKIYFICILTESYVFWIFLNCSLWCSNKRLQILTCSPSKW